MKNMSFHIEIMISTAQHARGHATLRKKIKMCNLMRLGEYFDQVFALKLFI